MFIILNNFIDFVHYNERYGERTIILQPWVGGLTAVREHVKLVRWLRKLTMIQVAERADISRTTLWQMGRHASNVSLGAYSQVLPVLGLEQDLLKQVANDAMGIVFRMQSLLSNKGT